MIRALENIYLSWDLVSPTEYTAGEELECIVGFTAPEDDTYYLIGALYTSGLEYISGTLFGVLLPEGATYAVNSVEYTSLWEMVAGEVGELPCKLTFNRSDVVFGLFLMRLTGTEPSFDDDEEITSLSIQLASPTPPTPPAPPITLESLIAMVMMVGVVSIMMNQILKE